MAQVTGLLILAIFICGITHGTPAAIIKLNGDWTDDKNKTSLVVDSQDSSTLKEASKNNDAFNYAALLQSLEDEEKEKEKALARFKRASPPLTPLKLLELLLKKIKNKRLRKKIIELIKRKLKRQRIKARNRNKIFRLIQLLINALKPNSFTAVNKWVTTNDFDSYSYSFSSNELYNIDYGSWKSLETLIAAPDVTDIFTNAVNEIDTLGSSSDASVIPDLSSLGSSSFFADLNSYSTSLSGFSGLDDTSAGSSLLNAVSSVLDDSSDYISASSSLSSSGIGSNFGSGSTSGSSNLGSLIDPISIGGSNSGSGSSSGIGSLISSTGGSSGLGSLSSLGSLIGSTGSGSLGGLGSLSDTGSSAGGTGSIGGSGSTTGSLIVDGGGSIGGSGSTTGSLIVDGGASIGGSSSLISSDPGSSLFGGSSSLPSSGSDSFASLFGSDSISASDFSGSSSVSGSLPSSSFGSSSSSNSISLSV